MGILDALFGFGKKHGCLNCEIKITEKVFDYSTKHYTYPLCYDCQGWLKEMFTESTIDTINLYFALRVRGVPAELEKYDGHKTIDIAVTDAKVNIEVDGMHHNYSAKQAMSDLQRTYYSFKKGYFTLRIPNSLIRQDLNGAADLITDFLNESQKRVYKRRR